MQPVHKINLTEYISQHYKDQNTVTQSPMHIIDVEQKEKGTEMSKY
jgi:hypothetical protein